MKKLTRHPISTSRITINHLLIVLLAIFVGVQVTISNRIATSGHELSKLEIQTQELERQNQALLSQDVEKVSLHELYTQAEKLGYTEPEHIIDLNDETTDLALK